MAAVLAKGETTIYNAACEPYIQHAIDFAADKVGIENNKVKLIHLPKLLKRKKNYYCWLVSSFNLR
ncbi:hypothetical protein N9K77_00700 [bacterium]|nr:hypothetical protein [bacterium]